MGSSYTPPVNLASPGPIGNVTPSTGAFTDLSETGTLTIPGSMTYTRPSTDEPVWTRTTDLNQNTFQLQQIVSTLTGIATQTATGWWEPTTTYSYTGRNCSIGFGRHSTFTIFNGMYHESYKNGGAAIPDISFVQTSNNFYLRMKMAGGASAPGDITFYDATAAGNTGSGAKPSLGISAGGNVRVGNTAATIDSTGAKFQVFGTQATATCAVIVQDNIGAGFLGSAVSSSTFVIGCDGPVMAFRASPTVSMAGGAEVGRWDMTNARLGVGSSNPPLGTLDVYKASATPSIRITTDTSQFSGIDFYRGVAGTNVANLFLNNSDNVFTIGTNTAANFQLRYNASNVIVLGSTGATVTGIVAASGDISTTAIGKTLLVKSGSNALAGTVTLSSGAGTISSTALTANSVIQISLKTASGVITVAPYLTAITAGTSATVAAGAGDNSTYNWIALGVN